MKPLPNESEFKALMTAQKLEHGIYSTPYMDPAAPDHEKAMQEITEKYKKGPNAMLIVGRTGEEPMDGKILGMEFGSNFVAALLASWVVSRFGPNNNYCHRWFAVLLIGVAAWFSISASYNIWYRFHEKYILDELLCVLLESALAATAIAAIVRPQSTARTEVN